MGPTAVSFCNAAVTALQVWIEPWCDELEVPPRGELRIEVEANDDAVWEPELEIADHGLTVWAAGGTRIRFHLDGVEQDTGSAVLTAPGFGSMGTKAFVDVVFGNFPETRPGGLVVPKRNWFQRLFGIS